MKPASSICGAAFRKMQPASLEKQKVDESGLGSKSMNNANIHDAKTHFSKLLERIENDGQPITICRNGKAIAELIPYRPSSRIKTHPTLSKIKIDYDPSEPLAEDEWPREGK
jgi:prevent-host-death family protein